jgi:hypothetical protein
MCEMLESRRMLAGNVSATDDGTTITIVGDNKSNQIVVTGELNNAYTIKGDKKRDSSEFQKFRAVPFSASRQCDARDQTPFPSPNPFSESASVPPTG